MLTHKTIEESVKGVVAKTLHVHILMITPRIHFYSLGANWIDIIEIVLELDKMYKISLPIEIEERFGWIKIRNIKNTTDLVRHIINVKNQ